MLIRIARAVAVILLSAAPALAWETRPGRVCELIHDGENAFVRVTYDPAIAQYAIEVRTVEPWPGGPIFAMRFDGPRGLTITTDRHIVSDGGQSLTVTDSGFDNVLNGLEFNHTATALLGDRAVPVSLDGAAPAVQEFRACAAGLNA